jgi:hypothetical protein
MRGKREVKEAVAIRDQATKQTVDWESSLDVKGAIISAEGEGFIRVHRQDPGFPSFGVHTASITLYVFIRKRGLSLDPFPRPPGSKLLIIIFTFL